MKKITMFITLLMTASCLTGCHKNPLKTNAKEARVGFLIEASHAAGERLSLTTPTGSYAYRDCVEGKAGMTECAALFNAMVEFAHNSPIHEFKDITVAELADPELFKTIAVNYDETLFYTPLEEK